MISPEELRSILAYDPSTGVLTWLPRPSDPRFKVAGQRPAVRIHKDGGHQITIRKTPYRINRVVFAWMTGRWPDRVRSHNNDPSDQRWENLSEITPETIAAKAKERAARKANDKRIATAERKAVKDAERQADREAKALVKAETKAAKLAASKDRKRERNRLINRQWKKANPDKVRAQKSKRRAVKREAYDPSADPKAIEAIYTLRHRMEAITGLQYHVDHVIPLARGGKHHQDNLVVMFGPANEAKGDKIIPSLIRFFTPFSVPD